jgi:hypothetical protein
VKAQLPRSEARRPTKAKAELRPSSVVLKKSPPKPAAAKPAKPAAVAASKGNAKPTAAATTKPSATKATSASTKSNGAAPTKPTPPVAAAKTLTAKHAPSAKAAVPAKAASPSKASATKTAAPAGKPSKVASAKPAPAVEPAPSVPPPPKKPARKSIKEAAGVSTDAVARRTGKTWDDWFEILDSAGAASLDQRGVVAILAQKHGIGPWWQQTIATGYESLRAKATDKPPAPEGFQITTSCTLDAPVKRVFRLWNDAGERARWLADERFVVRAGTADKIIKARWGKGTSHVAVSFSEKGGKTEVAVEHQQIESRAAADQMKAYWEKKLGLLDGALSSAR